MRRCVPEGRDAYPRPGGGPGGRGGAGGRGGGVGSCLWRWGFETAGRARRWWCGRRSCCATCSPCPSRSPRERAAARGREPSQAGSRARAAASGAASGAAGSVARGRGVARAREGGARQREGTCMTRRNPLPPPQCSEIKSGPSMACCWECVWGFRWAETCKVVRYVAGGLRHPAQAAPPSPRLEGGGRALRRARGLSRARSLAWD